MALGHGHNIGPAIVNQAESVTMVQRSPSYYIERPKKIVKLLEKLIGSKSEINADVVITATSFGYFRIAGDVEIKVNSKEDSLRETYR